MTEVAAKKKAEQPEGSIVETLQSLIVAFVLAMTFRGFVTEGFVIPTGSMAPTLLGQHKQLRSEQTGWTFPAGDDRRGRPSSIDRASDPMLGPDYEGSIATRHHARMRMGDRILVLKGLYHFTDPHRFDVVVFKNPTNPNGEDGNYIKRLIGLPNESIWLVDGDVFAGSADRPGEFDLYQVQRKPEHIQRAVWQPVYHSDYYPREPARLDETWRGAPWQGQGWITEGQPSFRSDTAAATRLDWDPRARDIDDWTPYNSLTPRGPRRSRIGVSDVRVAAALVPDDEGLETRLELRARSHVFEFTVGHGRARVRMRPADWDGVDPDQGWSGPDPVEIATLPAERATTVEFWHADQSMIIFVNGKRVVDHEYDWRPPARLRNALGREGDPVELARIPAIGGPELVWHFEGSPVTLHRVRVDRDLHYRGDRLGDAALRNPTNPGFERVVRSGLDAFGTNPKNLAVLGPDHFFMAGDNSSASSDSRLWGNPHPVVATQIDISPFVVNRKLLLGKAWVVYFPAPHAMTDSGRAFIPDFGRLRFIR